MDWSELALGGVFMAFVVAVPLVFAWAVLRTLHWWKPERHPRRLPVYAASLLMWILLLAVLAVTNLRYGAQAPDAGGGSGAPVGSDPGVTPPVAFPPGVSPPVASAPPPSMPAFPWPPPVASAETAVPDNWLPARGAGTLADVAAALERALGAARFPKWSYSSVPDGFALVSRIEQIRADGTPSPEPARWSADMPSVASMTLLEFIRALVNAQPGYYRVIVFIVTSRPWPRTGATPTGAEADQWLARGFNRLPESVGLLPYGPAYRTTALVYEFRKVSNGAVATLLEPSPTSAHEHMAKAGISEWLSRR